MFHGSCPILQELARCIIGVGGAAIFYAAPCTSKEGSVINESVLEVAHSLRELAAIQCGVI